MRFAEMTAPDLLDLPRDPTLVVAPIAACEQHATHLPVITDTILCGAVADGVEAALPDRVLLLPVLWLGASEHHLPFGGTLTATLPTYEAMLVELLTPMLRRGFRRILLLNGHGGNIDPLSVAARELAVEYGLPIVSCTPWQVASEAVAALLETQKGPHHACEAETSVMLAMTPDTVHTDKLEEAVRQAPPAIKGRAGYGRFWSFSERAPITGTIGDPRAGTAAKGEKLLDAMAAALAEGMADRELWRTPDPVWSAGRGLGKTAGSALD